jgi:hypothetical protein
VSNAINPSQVHVWGVNQTFRQDLKDLFYCCASWAAHVAVAAAAAAGTADRALVMQALRDAFNAFYSQQAAQGGPPGGRPFTGPAAPGIITECASFPGCWQLTLRVLSGINQATAADETARAQQHHFQGFKHQVAKRANGSWVVEAT